MYFLQPAPDDAVLSRKYDQLKEKSHSQSAQPQQRQSTADEVNNQPGQAQPKQNLSFGAAIVQLLGIGLASPFLEMQDPFHGIIGLVILMIGIRIAWQITAGSRRARIEGPYETSSAASM
jgi:predicted lipid-binding transport protein (Tim44 family)